MKKIIFILILISIQTLNLKSEDFRLNQLISGLNSPWSLTFKNENEILITEKSGQILFVNLKDNKIKKVKHNLNVLEDGQGGLLEILYHKETVFVSYSENRGNGKSSTSVASANFNYENLNFKNIFRAEPPINSGYHFGSRLVIKDDFLFITAGERGEGMIAQDPTKHPGSIIRIYMDGKIPKDNPKFKGKESWLPEIFQIGVRNPQGMDVSPFNKKIYLTNHGARGGDWFGEASMEKTMVGKFLGWGGTNYTGTKIGS